MVTQEFEVEYKFDQLCVGSWFGSTFPYNSSKIDDHIKLLSVFICGGYSTTLIDEINMINGKLNTDP